MGERGNHPPVDAEAKSTNGTSRRCLALRGRSSRLPPTWVCSPSAGCNRPFIMAEPCHRGIVTSVQMEG